MTETIKSGVYQILNIVNNKVYIGSTINFYKRFGEHRCSLLLNKHSNPKLQAAYNKYGVDNFVYSVVEHCYVDNLLTTEQKYIDALDFKNDYNIALIAGSNLGLKFTQETKAKMSLVRKGKVRSAEHQAKLTLALKGRKRSDEHQAKLNLTRKGKTASEETKLKMSLSALNQSDETKAKISAALKGRVKSEEWKTKMSLAGMGKLRPKSEEAIENHRQSLILTNRKKKLFDTLNVLNDLLTELVNHYTMLDDSIR